MHAHPHLGVDCACTTCNWHELCMHRTNSAQSCFGLVNEATKNNPAPLPFSFVMCSLPASFLSFLFCRGSTACLLMHDLPAAPSDSVALALALLLASRRFGLPSLHILHVRCQFCVIRAVRRNLQFLPV